MLELGKAISFFLSLLSLYPVVVSAFFAQGHRWEERLTMALLKLAISACICFASGLLFVLPVRSNPDARQPIWATLPMKAFFFGTLGIAVLFVLTWYLVGGAPCYVGVNNRCSY
jgi:hypothetical protein